MGLDSVTSSRIKLDKGYMPEFWMAKMLPRLHIQEELVQPANSKSKS